ncbi:hypothetical protein PoB_005675600 [Plakobranchus ocellatus]|uniref:Uncharacterized protein n=1 Tax=Plakobranchus ocellatus TaxID=259542 RepID=A0AAV4C4K9_9GAST|nr:hypothetical protein PoB_005675600 [Plakobranchus ocellatus]
MSDCMREIYYPLRIKQKLTISTTQCVMVERFNTTKTRLCHLYSAICTYNLSSPATGRYRRIQLILTVRVALRENHTWPHTYLEEFVDERDPEATCEINPRIRAYPTGTARKRPSDCS